MFCGSFWIDSACFVVMFGVMCMFCRHIWYDSVCFVVMFGVTVHVLWACFV